jgi:hypothetical protein
LGQAVGAVAGVGAGVDVEMILAVCMLLGVGGEFAVVEEPDAAGGPLPPLGVGARLVLT